VRQLTVWHFVFAVLIAAGMLACGRPIEMRDKARAAPPGTVMPMPSPPSTAGPPANASTGPTSPPAQPADALPLPWGETAAPPVPSSEPHPASLRLATVEGDRITTAKPIVFNPNDTIALPESAPVLDVVVDLLRASPALRVEIRVHIDRRDDTGQYGRKPSEYRAQRVMRYLISRGVDPDRLTAKGYGSTQPLTQGRTPRERAQNRRTEFVIQRVP
jgi:outer membrane protein OmpA-like peptidoglycan-associated protein